MKVNKEYVLGLMVVLVSIIAFGASVNYHYTDEVLGDEQIIDKSVLDRAYNDVVDSEDSEWLIPLDKIIKVFDENDELIDTRILSPDELPDQEFSILLNQASFMAEYNNSRIYRVVK
ncbi:hypothetical protein BXY85_3680 [Roseivirga pacifica]|uniref:Uncharacterized protein n=1 Tax=Roseivirga pacifica TaxID=1267423 RepID=A0A1I0QC86_9BACT|nr:hypothetical protein [Roseivirga pacifica]MCO6360698.1 hypothetical protein [Roseivirga pacifica]MCO6368587.1 hypothetical protein [Roseivirga pacifica]MCO6372729.1 hypothetical protein [Roseivirga pacifica]MCO6376787.1 hypothetical protein [Roseivirga pacifica]MCO6377933.1 hypothetical protein [Roseivirga pacifica]